MIYLTLGAEGELDDARRAAVDQTLRHQGGSAVWRANPRAGRWYALLELPDEYDRKAIERTAGPALYDKAIIALAVFPTVAEALPRLLDALGGSGRPAGVLGCHRGDGAVVVEWDPEITTPSVIMGLIDVELRRFESGRAAVLLSPISAAVAAKIAACGLRAPEIEPERILELRMPHA